METNLEENKILFEKNSKLEDKIVYLQKEIECYKKEINSLQEKHNLEKSRSAQYKNKFLRYSFFFIVLFNNEIKKEDVTLTKFKNYLVRHGKFNQLNNI